MEFLIEPFLEFLAHLLVYPGAYIRWKIFQLFGSNKTYKDYLDSDRLDEKGRDYNLSLLVGLLLFLLVLSTIILFFILL